MRTSSLSGEARGQGGARVTVTATAKGGRGEEGDGDKGGEMRVKVRAIATMMTTCRYALLSLSLGKAG